MFMISHPYQSILAHLPDDLQTTLRLPLQYDGVKACCRRWLANALDMDLPDEERSMRARWWSETVRAARAAGVEP